MSHRYESFGRVHPPAERVLSSQMAIARLKSGDVEPRSLLAYGNGRSYGDSCLNLRGSLVDMGDLNRILAFDRESGIVTIEAGLLLSDLIAFAAPFGYFPPVVPGTQFVTVGGAVANDVHGKNHHRRGTFGAHVKSLELLRSDGRTYQCSADRNPTLFAATIGGMGLTGIVLSVELQLMAFPSLDIVERVARFRNLEEFLDLAEQADAENEYAVAWIDQLATGAQAGRGLLMMGNHAEVGRRGKVGSPLRLTMPFTPPFTVINKPFLRLFNAIYRRVRGRRSGQHVSGYQSFFFPLDRVRHWNRLYGPRGLHQHQSVIPLEAAPETIPAMLAATQRAGQGSCLTVLKRFGALRSPGILSFPRPGYTLTLDFPHRGESTLSLLAELDRMTVAAGGAVNPYKDGRMSPQTFAASFPNWRELEALRDQAFSSGFWRRTAERLAGEDVYVSAAAE